MKFVLLTLTLLTLIPAPATLAAERQPVTLTFYVSGVECGSCVYVVQQSVAETKGVSDVTVVQVIDNYAKVSFDPQVVSEHQIAQAVREGYPLHGMPYQFTLKLRVPDYANKGNSSRVDALFAQWKDSVLIDLVDKAKGEFVIHFLPLKVDAKKAGPQGWSLAQLTQAMKAPAGLGIEFTLQQEEL